MSLWASLKTAFILAGMGTAAIVGGFPLMPPAAHAAAQPKQTVSQDASTAVAQMGKSLLADQYSFQVRTLRVYADTNGEPLHIAHSMQVMLRRPDRLRIDVTGDDGSTKLFYDGKAVVIFGVDTKKFVSIPVPDTIQGMVETVMGRLGVDFPLADFLTNDPAKSFLFGVTAGREVNTVTIDGVPCRHLVFDQPPGIELELWVEKNARSLPRRLVVTYHNLPGVPTFVAELSDWNFSIHPSDADFAFQPPEGAVQVALKPAAATPAKPTGGKH